MGVYMLVFLGCHPLGALVNGLFADRFGLQYTMLACDGILVAIALVIVNFMPMVRRLK